MKYCHAIQISFDRVNIISNLVILRLCLLEISFGVVISHSILVGVGFRQLLWLGIGFLATHNSQEGTAQDGLQNRVKFALFVLICYTQSCTLIIVIVRLV